MSWGFFSNNKWNKNILGKCIDLLILQKLQKITSIPSIYLSIYFPAQSNEYFKKLHRESKLGPWRFFSFSFLFSFSFFFKSQEIKVAWEHCMPRTLGNQLCEKVTYKDMTRKNICFTYFKSSLSLDLYLGKYSWYFLLSLLCSFVNCYS